MNAWRAQTTAIPMLLAQIRMVPSLVHANLDTKATGHIVLVSLTALLFRMRCYSSLPRN